jgi:predicted phage terminase large subunit-like protein
MPTPNLSNLSPEDRKTLLAALQEMQVRGIPIPKTLLNPAVQEWPVDKDGYFIRGDGKHFSVMYTDDKGERKVAEAKKNFIASPAFYSGLNGGRGSGKTGSGAQRALKKIMQGQSGVVINPDFENMRFSTWPEFKQWIPWGMVVPSQRNRRSDAWQPRQPFLMVFLNGAKVYVKGLKNADSARGPNINWLWYDEASRDATGDGWRTALASVRIGPNPRAWATFTPKGKEHWTYQFFVKQDIPKEILKLLPEGQVIVEYFRTSIMENRDNLDPDFFARMLATYPPGWQRDQELYGQFVEEGGVLGDPAWFIGHYLPEPRPQSEIKKRIRYWDLAATEKDAKNKDPDSTVGGLYSLGIDIKFCIEHQISGQWKWDKIKKEIVRIAQDDGPYVEIYIEQEPGSGGKNQIAEIAALPELAGYMVHPHEPEGDKVQRANTWFGQAALGNVYMVKDSWNEPVLDQLSSFPQGRHDDRIDDISGAYQVLVPIRKWSHMEFLSLSSKSVEKLREQRKLDQPDGSVEPSKPGIARL